MTITYAAGRTALAPLSRDWVPWPDCGCPQGTAAIASDPARYAYLFDPSLPARPPTADELARYAASATDALDGPSLITAPPSLPVAGDLEPLHPVAPAAVAGEIPAESLDPLPVPGSADAAEQASRERLAQWGADTGEIPVAATAESEESR